jgi:competence protein ComEC
MEDVQMKKKNKKLMKRIIEIVISVIIIVCATYFTPSETLGNNESTAPTSNQQAIESLPTVQNGELKVYVFDVGQADCILAECNDSYMLIDAGNNPDGKLIVKQLNEMGITKIDYLVGTHPHEDHIGGLDNILKNFEVGVLYMPAHEYDSATYRDVVKAAKENSVDNIAPELGHIFYVGDAKCEIMAIDNEDEDPNINSIIIEMTYGKNKFLFTGDAEIENEERRLWNDIDVLKVAHHGSGGSSGEEFLEAVRPKLSLISCGKNNSYGHPHEETLVRLQKTGSKVISTIESGQVTLQVGREKIKVKEYKK